MGQVIGISSLCHLLVFTIATFLTAMFKAADEVVTGWGINC